MYIQHCTSKQNGKTYTYPLLCRKYREDGKIKTEVIANLTKFPSELVLAIAGALKKGKEVLVSLKDIVIKKSIDYGFVFVLLALMDRLRITEVLEKTIGDHAKFVRLMIVGKIITRGSKLCIFNWIKRNEAVAKKLDIDLTTLNNPGAEARGIKRNICFFLKTCRFSNFSALYPEAKPRGIL